MKPSNPSRSRLAPLQEVMLRDSFAAPSAGYHVEQLEIVFADDLPAERIASAWARTVDATEALGISFDLTSGIPTGHHPVESHQGMQVLTELPISWEYWLESDRRRRILFPGEVPWRTAWHPPERRFVWTFHHALLDGRSISRVARSFLTRLGDASPDALPLSKWQAPSPESVRLAIEIFKGNAAARDSNHLELPPDSSTPGSEVRELGNGFARSLETRAAVMKASVASIVTWAWGQAITEISGSDAVMVEQVRSGAPQPGTAGFTMNVLPLLIRRSDPSGLPEFMADLAALRQIESVSPADFAAGIYPDVDAPEISTVMVEHETIGHSMKDFEMVKSVVLHERIAESTMATACLRPAFRLKVEGPHRQLLLERWISVLERLAS